MMRLIHSLLTSSLSNKVNVSLDRRGSGADCKSAGSKGLRVVRLYHGTPIREYSSVRQSARPISERSQARILLLPPNVASLVLAVQHPVLPSRWHRFESDMTLQIKQAETLLGLHQTRIRVNSSVDKRVTPKDPRPEILTLLSANG